MSSRYNDTIELWQIVKGGNYNDFGQIEQGGGYDKDGNPVSDKETWVPISKCRVENKRTTIANANDGIIPLTYYVAYLPYKAPNVFTEGCRIRIGQRIGQVETINKQPQGFSLTIIKAQ